MQKLETNLKVRNKKVIIIIIALLLVSYAIYCNKENIIGLFYKQTVVTHNHIVQESENNIVSSSHPEALAEGSNQAEEEGLSHSLKVTQCAECSPNYRNYLLGVNLLVMNFLQDKDYTKQISQIETIQLPQEIKNILLDFYEYNTNYLINASSITTRIFPKDSWWIEKFIKIEKKSNLIKDKEKLRSKIIENLEFFIIFFYSEKLQQEFIEEKYK